MWGWKLSSCTKETSSTDRVLPANITNDVSEQLRVQQLLDDVMSTCRDEQDQMEKFHWLQHEESEVEH